MTTNGNSASLGETTNDRSQEVRQRLRLLDRKNWWHWWNTVLVIMLLMGGIGALSLPRILSDKDISSQVDIETAVRGLLGVVLIFNIYMLYQQHLLGLLRKYLSNQMEVATEQRVRAEAYYELAILDPLTGLYNRRYSEEKLASEIARADRCGNPLVVILLDLDNFKDINDRYGHCAGDIVLKEFARRLSKGTRGSDVAVRLGGDEFLVILPDCPPEKIGIVMSRLAEFEVETAEETIEVSSSRGWAQYKPADTAEKLMNRADASLYENKALRLTRGSLNDDADRESNPTVIDRSTIKIG
jgi:two-component system cell cycle response regulator